MTAGLSKIQITDKRVIFASILVIIFCMPVYSPGLGGPFVFDDLTNIVFNDYLKITSLDWHSIRNAASSGISGPLGRPIPMLSFAVDYLVAGSFGNTAPFKITNLVIHLLNGILVFFFLLRIFAIDPRTGSRRPAFGNRATIFISVALSLVWLLHPIQVNAVHYVVQRMTSLSAMFVLAALIIYINGRLAIAERKRAGFVYAFLVSPLLLTLGMLCKENAILGVPLIIAIEFFLLSAADVSRWFARSYGKPVLAVIVMLGVLVLAYLVNHFLPGYDNRNFSMVERLLTEARVLVHYLYMIVFPRINDFGLFHDDIAVSTGLFTPPGTLFSILLLIALGCLAYALRRKQPLVALGIAWYFIAHSLESTIIPLELVHEHRNYLALLGPVMTLQPLLQTLHQKGRYRYVVAGTVCLILVLGMISHMRSMNWRSMEDLITTEAYFRPDSARARAGLGSLLASRGDLANALVEMEVAHQLQPGELGYALNLAIIHSWADRDPPTALKISITDLMQHGRLTPLSYSTLNHAVRCSINSCHRLYPLLMEVLDICAQREDLGRGRTQCLYYKGSLLLEKKKFEESLPYFDQAAASDNGRVLALIGKGKALLELNRLDETAALLPRLVDANRQGRFPRDKEIQRLIYLYNQAKNKDTERDSMGTKK